MTRLGCIAFALLAACGPAAGAACPGMFDRSQVSWHGWRAFFSGTNFGTVGIALDNTSHVFVPGAGVTCIATPRPRSKFFIVFNHRNSPVTGAGYVSFKLYGLKSKTPATTVLLAERRGDWQRGNDPLPLWTVQPAYARPYPGIVERYENFYSNTGSAELVEFDREFGRLHGTPKGSNEDSWTGRFGMQPDVNLVDLSRVGYIMHNLQRVEVTSQANGPGDPPKIETGDFRWYDDMLVTVSSPLGEGMSTTLLFRFRN